MKTRRTLVFMDMFITVRASRVSVSTLAAPQLRRGAVLKRFNTAQQGGTQHTHTHTQANVWTSAQLLVEMPLGHHKTQNPLSPLYYHLSVFTVIPMWIEKHDFH